MPGCVLHIAGKAFDAHQAMASRSLVPYAVWRQGEPRGARSTRIHENGGVTFLVSDPDGGSVPQQIADAIRFLQTHQAQISQLTSAAGVEEAYFDFGWDFPYQRSVGQWNDFPTELLKLCAACGLSICVSVYAAGDDDPHR
jgi:hypothetical protein